MLRVENVRVYELVESIVASGYAMGLNLDEFKDRGKFFEKYIIGQICGFSDFYKDYLASSDKETLVKKYCNKYYPNNDKAYEEFKCAFKDYNRMIKLVQASKNGKVKCHHNFTTGIRVSFDLIYPNYISPEMQRYHWFDIVTSSSKMHRIMKMDFSKCCNEYVTDETKANMKQYIDEYNRILNTPVVGSLSETDKHNEELYKAFMRVISNCPQGVELFMRVSTNYMQLQTMYYQRQHHKLKEDWGNFCKFIESLPLADELIIGNL